jgi:hypothetical protein
MIYQLRPSSDLKELADPTIHAAADPPKWMPRGGINSAISVHVVADMRAEHHPGDQSIRPRPISPSGHGQ